MPLKAGMWVIFTSSISAEKINVIKESARPGIKFMEKIKVYFFTTYHAEVPNVSFKLYHYQNRIPTPVQFSWSFTSNFFEP